MDSSYSFMKNALESTTLYDASNKNIRCELLAYADVIDAMKVRIVNLINEAFIDTAESIGLNNREMLIGAVRDDLETEKRRDMLKKRETIGSDCFTLEKIKDAIRSFGLEFELYEYPSLYEVVIVANAQYTKEQQSWIREQIKKIMPCHLITHVIFGGPLWSEIDSFDNSFSYMDNCDLSWEQIDNLE